MISPFWGSVLSLANRDFTYFPGSSATFFKGVRIIESATLPKNRRLYIDPLHLNDMKRQIQGLWFFRVLKFSWFPEKQSVNNQTLFKIVFIYLFIREWGREGEREEEKHQWVVTFHRPPAGDWVYNPGTCPGWESNWQHFGLHAPCLILWATLARATRLFLNFVKICIIWPWSRTSDKNVFLPNN